MTDAVPRTTSRPVVLTPWTPRWAEEYATIAERLRAATGADALRVDHVGSTSIEGLAAKDVIDVQITVADLQTCGAMIARLRQAGFTRGETIERDDAAPDTLADPTRIKRYAREPEGERRMHVHIRQLGYDNQRMALLFRDYLRASALQRGHYETVKRRAALLFPDSIDGYIWVKDAPIRMLLEAAEMWAERVGWAAGAHE